MYIALTGPYQYEPTVVEGCDPERNEEYRTAIEDEVDALISEYFSMVPDE